MNAGDHNDGSGKNIEVVKPAQSQLLAPQESLENLIKALGPIATNYFDNQLKMQERELAYNERILVEETKRHKTVMWASVAIVIAVFALALLFILKDHNDTAMQLIQLVIAVIGAAFGGYGVAKRFRVSADESGE